MAYPKITLPKNGQIQRPAATRRTGAQLVVCNGATYANIDMLKNKKDGSRMLVIEDYGGGMDPDKLRQCMSLGYSLKSKVADTIGQYGNGFKTSTMRLGADVIVFTPVFSEKWETPLMVLLAGDNDFAAATSVISNLGYPLVTTSLKKMPEDLELASKHMSIDFKPFMNKKEPSSIPTIPEDDIDTVLEAMSKSSFSPSPIPIKDGVMSVGIFIDVNSVRFKREELPGLIQSLKSYANQTKNGFNSLQMYGPTHLLPKTSKDTKDEFMFIEKLPVETTEELLHIRTKQEKARNPTNSLIAGIGKYVLQNGKSEVILLSANKKLATTIEGFTKLGIRFTVLHPKLSKELMDIVEHLVSSFTLEDLKTFYGQKI
ncbi:Histidine kinase-like ATPase, ATP-binding domain-containing protein [Artemisia annua]|uniref:Histidine kinase-like ATPase, ATP-binding domain-containing protein n=1 Tax=Artemisia annua TaxID=35608 RepID=A0A2U1NES9_ARTAN|nr:Histidine kinase-like ATPase, ATP-binding domain-containing protein [Artemisia annua]